MVVEVTCTEFQARWVFNSPSPGLLSYLHEKLYTFHDTQGTFPLVSWKESGWKLLSLTPLKTASFN